MEKKEESYFYLTICKPTGEFYYGSGSKEDYLGSGKELLKRIEEYGPDEFEHVRLRYFDDRDEAYTFEDRFLRLYKINTLEKSLNIAKGARGVKHTEEARKKIGEAQKGKNLSEEHKRQISELHKGKTLSEEHKKKLSNTYKGENNPRYDHTIYNFVHKDGTEFIGTQYELRTTYNLDGSNLTNLINGKNKSYKGWSLVS